nr:hypothetical protein [Tanacetum cinerariifolium]
MGTPAGRVVLFGTIPTTIPDTTPMITPPTTYTPIITPTIPPSPDYTPASLNYSPASEADDTSDTPPSPTHDTPFTEINASTQRSPVIPHPSSRHSSSDHSSPDLMSTSAGPARKRRRVERVVHPAMPKDIPKPAQEGEAEVTHEILGDLVQSFHDHTQAILVHRIQTTEGIQREQGRRIVRVELAVTALTERVAELERDNQRLRGTASVESHEHVSRILIFFNTSSNLNFTPRAFRSAFTCKS